MKKPIISGRIYLLLWTAVETIFIGVSSALFLMAVYPFSLSAVSLISSTVGLLYMLWKFRQFGDRDIAWMYEYTHPELKESLITYVETGDERLIPLLKKQKLRFWRIYRPDWRVFALLPLSAAVFALSFSLRKPLYLWKLGLAERKVSVMVDGHAFFYGEEVPLTVIGQSPMREEVMITGPDTSIALSVAPGDTVRDTLSSLDAGTYRLIFASSVLDSFLVIPRPVVESLRVEVSTPYLGRNYVFRNTYEVPALQGSLVRVKVFHDGDSVHFVGVDSAVRVVSDTQIAFRLYRMGKSYVFPKKIIVRMVRDMPPLVRIVIPSQKFVYLPEDGIVPLGAVSTDDIGLRRVTIRSVSGNSVREVLSMKPDSPVRDTFLRHVDLNSSGMLPGDEIRIEVVAEDLRGQKSRDVITVRFPTLHEQMSMSDTMMATSTGRMEDVFEKADQLQEDVRRIYTMDSAGIKGLMERVEEINREMQEVSKQLQEMSRFIPFDEELQQMVEKLEDIYRRILDEEMRSILEKLQKLRDSRLSDAERKRLMDRVVRDMERLKESIRATYETLNRFYQEKRLKELSEQLKELAFRQEIASTPAEQDSIAARMDSISSAMKELAGQLESPFGDSLRNMGREADSLSSATNRMAQQMRAGREIPQNQRREMARRMRNLSSRMSGMLSSMVSSRKKEILDRLKQIREQVSFILYNSDVRGYQEQQNVVDALRVVLLQLREVMPKNFLISASIVGYLYSAFDNADEARARMYIGDDRRARLFIDREQKDLLLSLIEVGKSMNQISSASSSTGFQEMLQQMAKAMGEQASLNGRLQMMLSRGNVPVEAYRNLADQQARIRQMLEGVRRGLESIGERGKEHARRLREIEKEMEDIERRIRLGKVDRKLLERQRKILNRLLEAYTGLKSQELERKREAVKARPYRMEVPPVPEEVLIRRRIMELMTSPDRVGELMEIYRSILRRF